MTDKHKNRLREEAMMVMEERRKIEKPWEFDDFDEEAYESSIISDFADILIAVEQGRMELPR